MIQRRKFVDSHLHLWDLTANPWYAFPQPGPDDFGLGLTEPFPDVFGWDEYARSVAELDLVKFVHVTAVTRPGDVEAETAWVDAIARETHLPYALIGTVDLTQPLDDIIATLDREQRFQHYRGLRLLGGADYTDQKIQTLLSLMAERKLVYDAVANTGGIAAAAKGLERHPDLVTVLEHTGWPLATDDAHIAAWREEIAAFAALPNTYCKLSGLGMTVHGNALDLFRRFFDPAIASFGPERCMFGSNFPVDLNYGPAGELFAIFDAIAADFTAADADSLFAGTAERVYRI